MKKRLRKKLCVGEFAVMCFVLRAEYVCDDEEALWNRFVGKVEELEMICMGEWDDGHIDLCCETGYVGNDEEARRETFAAWLKEQPEYREVYISPLFDGCKGLVEE